MWLVCSFAKMICSEVNSRKEQSAFSNQRSASAPAFAKILALISDLPDRALPSFCKPFHERMLSALETKLTAES